MNDEELALRREYACPFCNRVLPVNADGVIVHDDVPHPDDWAPESEEEQRH